MAFLYWIHLEEHDDPSAQGYVGITTQKVNKRFDTHIQCIRSERNYCKILYNAFHKYGRESLLLKVLHKGSLEEVLRLENEYRPKPNIGWNIAIGGQATRKGSKVPKSQALRHSKLLKDKMKYPWQHPDAAISNWGLADKAYILWGVKSYSYKRLAKYFNTSQYAFSQMVKEFKAGWNPLTCPEWRKDFNYD